MFNSPTDFEILCTLLNYRFNNSQLLEQALTRKSGLLEGRQEKHIGHNERLEFLGDSILRTVIDDIMFELYPNYNEEQLSNIRDQWVAKDGFLYKVAEKIKLETFMMMGNGEITNCRSLGRKKILTDTMEAIIGAVFLDSERNYATVKQFISLHSDLQLLVKTYRNKQLFEAVKNSDLTNVKYWLNQGADPNALHQFSYDISCPCCLDVGIPSWYEVCCYANSSNTLDLAIRRLDGFTENTLAIVKALLKHGAKPNNKGLFSHTVLHETLVYYPKRWRGYHYLFTELIYLLCEYGADANLRDTAICHSNSEMYKYGYTPLELAIISAEDEKVRALLRCGANPNITNNKGQAALHLACIYYEIYAEEECNKDYLTIFTKIINNLLKFKADPFIVDNNNFFPADYTSAFNIKKLLPQYKPFSRQDNPFFASDSSYQQNPSAFFYLEEETKVERANNKEQTRDNPFLEEEKEVERVNDKKQAYENNVCRVM